MSGSAPIRKDLAEETILFLSVLKWALIATMTGGLVGSATAGFLWVLQKSTDLTGRWALYYLPLPLVLFGSAALIRWLAPEAAGHGTEKVIEAFHKRAGRIPPAVVPVKLAATVLTLMFGGSAGKEGPCAQIGAGLTSALADLFRFEARDRKKFVICGISAGFAAVFGTPISGAIFGLEVLFAGSLLYEGLLPSFIAGITSYQVATALGISYFTHPQNFTPVFSESFFLLVLGIGAFCGLWSVVLIESLRWGERLAGKIPWWPPLRGLLGGALLVAGAFAFSPRYLGLGLDTVEQTLTGTPAPWGAPLLKSLFTTVTLSFGGSGGIVTPIFFVGTTAGSLYAQIFGLDVPTFAAIGMVCLLAGAANTPLAASIMAVELFGAKLAPFAAAACVVSFLMTGHRSVYPSQVLSLRKSASLHVQVGQTMEEVDAHFNLRKGGLIALVAHYLRQVRNRPRPEAHRGEHPRDRRPED